MIRKLNPFRALAVYAGLSLYACAPQVTWVLRSPDRSQEAQVKAFSKSQQVFIHGQKVGEYSGVAVGTFAFSGDGKRWAYAARKGESWALHTSQGEIGIWDGLGEILYSPDGSRLAFQTESKRRWSVWIHDFKSRHEVTSQPFDALMAGSMQFDPRGQHLAYAAQRGKNWHAVTDSILGPAWEGVRPGLWSADGRQFAFIARRQGKSYVVVDDKEWGPYAEARDLQWSQDTLARDYAFVATIGDAEAIVQTGGQTPAGFPSVRKGSLNFWPGHRHPVFVATLPEGGLALHVGGIAEASYQVISEPRSDATGKHWGYAARDSISWILSINAHEIGRYAWVSDPTFGRDGAYAFVLRQGKGMAVQYSGRSYAFDFLFEDTLVFDREGLHWGCVAGDAKARRFFFVRDGKKMRDLDLNEIAGITLHAPLASQAHRLRDWTAAELELANPPELGDP